MVRVDGLDAREIDLTHLRKSLGIVLQDSFLFRGTVRENIACVKRGATFAEVARAAQISGADEFIERLPRGYDTLLEENASNLSGGQKQRLAIARALICDPRILIFDEATSALDAESEFIIRRNLQRIAEGRTVIIVSHRLSMLTEAKSILVLERGRSPGWTVTNSFYRNARHTGNSGTSRYGRSHDKARGIVRFHCQIRKRTPGTGRASQKALRARTSLGRTTKALSPNFSLTPLKLRNARHRTLLV